MKKQISFGFSVALIILGQTCCLNLKQASAQSPDTVWTARYNGMANNNDEAQACAVDDSGNLYVTGESYNGANDDILTIKYNPVTGDTIWTRRYNNNGGEGAYGCAVDKYGNLYVVGHSGFEDITIKYNAITGDTMWTRSYNGLDSCDGCAYACAVDSTGNLYVTGETYYSGIYINYFTIKYNAATGDTIWTRSYNGPASGIGPDVAYGCVVDRSGNLYVTGMSEDANYDYLTIKYDAATGDTIWTQRYNGPENGGDWAYACAVDNLGNLYVIGYSNSDYLTIKYDADTGDTVWTARYYPGSSYSNAACVVDGSGNLYVVGYADNSINPDYPDYLVIKYNPVTGDTIWTCRYNGPENSVDAANGCAVDGLGNLYVTGISSGSAAYDYLTIKYNTSTGVEGKPGDSIQRRAFKLGQNAPNPFAHSTIIKYQTPQAGNLSLKVYNVAGQLVKTLINENSNPLRNGEGREGSITWDGRDQNNQPVSNGIYFYQLQAGDKQATKKLIKLR